MDRQGSGGTAAGTWRASKAQLRWRLYVALLLLDAAVLALAFALAGAVRFGDPLAPEVVALLLVTLPVYALAAVATGAYAVGVFAASWLSIGRALKALALAVALIALAVFLLKSGDAVSRVGFALGNGAGFVLLATARWLFGRHARRLLGGDPYDVVVIADGVAGIVPDACTIFVDASAVADPAMRDPASLDRLARVIGQADRVVVACPAERRLLWAAALQGANVDGEVLTPELGELQPIAVARYRDHATLVVARGPLGMRDRAAKRAFDLLVVFLAGVALLWLLLAVALLVKLTSRGPVLFRQQRIGRQNRLFTLYKFRTLTLAGCDADGGAPVQRHDARVTPLGRFLRATSLDEFPQLWNVLLGDMSVVGPRPHATGSRADDHLFWEIDSRYWNRHAIKPGLTGLAQVRGLRGATRTSRDLTDRLQSDLDYLVGWTIWRDVLIMLRTAAVLVHRNAF